MNDCSRYDNTSLSNALLTLASGVYTKLPKNGFLTFDAPQEPCVTHKHHITSNVNQAYRHTPTSVAFPPTFSKSAPGNAPKSLLKHAKMVNLSVPRPKCVTIVAIVRVRPIRRETGRRGTLDSQGGISRLHRIYSFLPALRCHR